MSLFLNIISSQRPISFAQDADGRDMWTINFIGDAEPPVRLLERQIGKLLEEELLLDPTTIYFGRNASIPSGAGPFISIIDTGGNGDSIFHSGPRMVSVGFQIVVRGKSVSIVEDRANTIWLALNDRHELWIDDIA